MMNEAKSGHIPVMLKEVLVGLNLRKNTIVVDGTLGLGGHSKEIIQALGSKGLLIGIDKDIKALELAKKSF